jgi:hypothetical protein
MASAAEIRSVGRTGRSVRAEFFEFTIEEEEEVTFSIDKSIIEVRLKELKNATDDDAQDDEFDYDEVDHDDDDNDESGEVEEEEKALKEKDDIHDALDASRKRIEILVQTNNEKDKKLEMLEQELHRHKVQHKEGIYWLQLQLDTARREKDASEERMAELQADLRAMLRIGEDNKISSDDEIGDNVDPEKLEMKERLNKYKTGLDVMENQLTMLMTSSGEVVKTLKEEIADLMEDRSKMELDLLNQLSALDNEKRRSDLEYESKLKLKDETIERLRAQGNLKLASSSDVDEMEDEISRLRQLKREAEDINDRERAEADDVIQRLEDDKSRLARRLEAAVDDMAILKSGPGAKGAVNVLDRIEIERENITSLMLRVASVWELADASILSLESAMDQLRPYDNTEINDDSERLLSTLESAALVHGQIKVSLLLVELKLRNQLLCLKSDKLTMGWAGPSDNDMERNMQDIQKDALTALSQVEADLSVQMQNLEETARRETAELKEELQQRVDKLTEVQEGYEELEAEVSRLKNSNNDSDFHARAAASGDDRPPISVGVLDQLHKEVIRIVDRIQVKDATISALTDELGHYKAREQNLRKELKKVLRSGNTAENGRGRGSGNKGETKVIGTETIKNTKTSSNSQDTNLDAPAAINNAKSSSVGSTSSVVLVEEHNRSASVLLLDFASPVKTPVSQKSSDSRRKSTGHDLDAQLPFHSPMSGIKPLQPSKREVSSKRRSPLPLSPPLVKTISPGAMKSPTGVIL